MAGEVRWGDRLWSVEAIGDAHGSLWPPTADRLRVLGAEARVRLVDQTTLTRVEVAWSILGRSARRSVIRAMGNVR